MRILILMLIAVMFGAGQVKAMIVEPQIDGCAYTDGGRWFGAGDFTNCGTGFHQDSNVAYRFSLDAPMTISSVEKNMVYFDFDTRTEETVGANLVIYEGSMFSEHTGITPSLDRIFEQRFSFIEDNADNDYSKEWRGLYNMSLTLNAGTYWASYEDGTRYLSVGGDQGLRLDCLENAPGMAHAPEPATIALIGSGLFGLLRRSKK